MRAVIARLAMVATVAIGLTSDRADEALPHWAPGEDIVVHLEKQPNHNTFVAALAASGLRARLKGPDASPSLRPPTPRSPNSLRA